MSAVFPKDFIWGVSSSSYQTEGAWNEDGRGPSIWDDFCHGKGTVAGGATGDIACDFYHRYEEDIRLMAKMGIKMARFSVSWSRVLPTGRGEINRAGLDFYIRVAKCCRDNGIEPMVTLFHWDLPSALMEEGGYSSPDFPLWFESYAAVVIKALSPYVEKVVTINQPYSVFKAVSSTTRAPALGSLEKGYLAALNCLLAHGRVVQLIRRCHPDMEVGIVINMIDFLPASDDAADRKAADFQNCLVNRLYLEALFKGAFPSEIVAETERLGIVGQFTSENNLALISEGIDFLGLNYYQSMMVKGGTDLYTINKVAQVGVPVTDGKRDITPCSFLKELRLINSYKPGIPVYITENGADYRDCGTKDEARICYLKAHLEQLSTAIGEGIDVKGYLLWTFMDNFEWENGYIGKYGIFAVDEKLKRIPKKSAFWYSEVIMHNGFA